MTDSQRKAMIGMHRRMEKAFIAVGKTKDAETAKRLRIDLESKTMMIESG